MLIAAMALDLPAAPPAALAERLAALVAALDAAADRRALLAEIADTATRWLAADGRGVQAPADLPERRALARWLADFVPGGTIVHFGPADTTVPSALAVRGAAVRAHLAGDVAAALAAAPLASPRIAVAPLEAAALGDADGDARADLCVVETGAGAPVLPLERAASLVRPGGWVAVLGAPAAAAPGLAAVGTFAADADGAVRPWPAERVGLAISLYRVVAG